MNSRVLVFIFLIFSFFKVNSQTYSIDLLPDAGETFTSASFSIYIPEDCDTVKGIIHLVYWYQGDSRNVINNNEYKTLGKQLGFAVLGSLLESRDLPNGVGRALLASLDSFSIRSSHPELKNAPLFFNGISWGGQWAYDFTLWKPERVIGLISQKGGYHTTGNAGDAINVPFYMFIGENDLDYRISNLTGIFSENRPLGAPWTIAIEPDAGHEEVSDTSLLFPYIRKIVELRLPGHIDIDSAVILKEIVLSEGYFGTPTAIIGNMKCYTGNTDYDAWLPDFNNAKKWQEFVSDGKFVNNVMDIDIYEGDSIIFGDTILKTKGTYYDIIAGCDSVITLNLNVISINPILITEITDNIKIYPNPATNKIYIDMPGNTQMIKYYNIIDMYGKNVKEDILNSESINVSELNQGIYILQLKVNKVTIYKKVIIR